MQKNNLNVIIFVDIPDLTLSELLEINQEVKLYQIFPSIIIVFINILSLYMMA